VRVMAESEADRRSGKSLAILVERRLNCDDTLHCLTDLFVTHGPPEHIRSDDGSEFTVPSGTPVA
jgi:putative transposase